MRRIASAALATAVLGAGTVVLAATPASAHPDCESNHYYYAISGKKTVWKATNVHSDWARKGVTISYAKNKTGTWTATGTATVGADAGVIFAKVSTSFSVSVGKSWAKSDTWTYSATVGKPPAGKSKGRLMMYHEAKGFTVTKYHYLPNSTSCYKSNVYKKSGTAPVKRNNNLWAIQYS
ncbi:hypothetical protein [Streptomyces sp. NBC_01465]|uniref:hypothetical protein n=1 Tax=Streptomyces sp. NBC_01465 TaxID=2903878 RepID=UPI002E310984|nr:hypothetical protein [Streptomyces sp. NBC_01465]